MITIQGMAAAWEKMEKSPNLHVRIEDADMEAIADRLEYNAVPQIAVSGPQAFAPCLYASFMCGAQTMLQVLHDKPELLAELGIGG